MAFPGRSRPAGAWLYRVARNRVLDHLRRDQSLRTKEDDLRLGLAESVQRSEEPRLPGEVTDDQLRLMFLCCHPALSRDARVALTLKTVAGFSVPEIARAFLARRSTIAQRLVRAQRRIRELRIPFEIPAPAELDGRLAEVLEVLYLLFNEGYGAHGGDSLVRSELCGEALRLASELAENPVTRRPAVDALVALLAFQSSRLPSRIDARGELVLLADQDRSSWDRRLIRLAFAHLERSAAGLEESTYHLEAGIAAHHAAAADSAETDWAAILELYDRLYEKNPSPVVALNGRSLWPRSKVTDRPWRLSPRPPAILRSRATTCCRQPRARCTAGRAIQRRQPRPTAGHWTCRATNRNGASCSVVCGMWKGSSSESRSPPGAPETARRIGTVSGLRGPAQPSLSVASFSGSGGRFSISRWTSTGL